MKVDLRYTGPGAEVGAHVKAYFYNREGKEIERFSKPPRRQDETKKYINALEKLEPGEKYEAFFPVSEALEKRDLKTVLITFGNQKETAALTDPKADLIAFNFDEKKLIFPGLNAGAKETKGAVDSPAKADHDSSIIIPGMRSVKQDKHPFFVQVNNSWKDEMVCLMTEVQVKGGLPSKVSVSAYFFSGTKKLVATLEKPTMAHFGKKVYSQIPAFAEKNQWYPVLFALDTELEKLRWEWAVIVFIADGRATAKVFGKLDVSITDFTFPGKDQLIKEKEENEE
ncbi:MAG: hypothetical protein HC845_04850 [Akkermansiaceae bacterium]|nr:hypothetical protein [Akkermansiaceae bacterium]